jgi:DNA-binding NarL/FixJ family response regulator
VIERERNSIARIVIADDNLAMLDSVAEILLDADYEVVGVVSDGTCVLAEVEHSQPDIVVLDISMGDINGLELARALQERSFPGKIIFLTVHEDQELLSAAIAAGGYAYVVKSRLDLDLLPALQTVMCGQLFVSASLRYH